MADFAHVDNEYVHSEETEDLLEGDTGRRYLCSACANPITSFEDRISVDGSFHHTFANPAGYLYRIGMFDSAQGSRIVGEYTSEFSWFGGYLWCYVVCARCLQHLGWHFSSTSGRDFFGLILEKLIEAE